MRVIWALDPFEKSLDQEPFQRICEVLRRMAALLPISVEPVYVLSPGQFTLPEEFPAQWIHQYDYAARQALEQATAEASLPFLKSPKVLVEELPATHHTIDTLSRFAESRGADLIIAHSHGRSGIRRLVMGSFVETLLSRSRIPVMVIGPDSKVDEDPHHVLFPTDFQPASRALFRSVVALTRLLHGELHLFHCVPHTIEPIFQSGVYLLGGTWIPVQSYQLTERRHVERRAKVWVRWASRQGTPTSLRIEQDATDVPEAILAEARSNKTDLIAMQNRRGSIASAIAGSTTRNVIRHAPCPVWVTGPRAAVKSSGKALPRQVA